MCFPHSFRIVLLLTFSVGMSLGQDKISLPPVTNEGRSPTRVGDQPRALTAMPSYRLGPEDSVLIRVRDVEEIGAQPYAVDLNGKLDLPRIGQVAAAGLTTEELEKVLAARYEEYLLHPSVIVSLADLKSQPVSVLGEVGLPGVHQIRGHRNLLEILSEAGGLRSDAGSVIKIAREKAWGPIPIPGSKLDSRGEYYIASVDIRRVMAAESSEMNVPMRPNDLITVPKAELVYVVGAVRRSGGFALSERSSVSVLEALTLAEGLDHNAGPRNARILRAEPGRPIRTEIPINVAQLMKGKVPDRQLVAGDILYIPTSVAKAASMKTLDSAIQLGTGLAIYRPF